MSTDEIQRTSTIKFDVHLDKENLPVSIDWTADDSDFERAINHKCLEALLPKPLDLEKLKPLLA